MAVIFQNLLIPKGAAAAALWFSHGALDHLLCPRHWYFHGQQMDQTLFALRDPCMVCSFQLGEAKTAEITGQTIVGVVRRLEVISVHSDWNS